MITDLRPLLLLVTGLGFLVAVRVAVWPLAHVSLTALGFETPQQQTSDSSRGRGAELGAAIVSRNPFRVGRRPVLPAYDPMRLAEQLAPPPQRPMLVLVGILNGRPPSAVIEGMPTVEGSRVVRVGDLIGGLTIKAINSGRVVISGMDTTWVLEVREPWKP